MSGPASRIMPAAARHLIWICAFAVLIVLKTWPLAADPGALVPGDEGDPLLNSALLHWNYLTLFDSGDWDAYLNLPFFHPHEEVLGWSENLFGLALLGWPIYVLTGSPVLTYSILWLLTFTLNGWSMCWLAYERTRRWLASTLAGLTLLSAHYFVVQQGHLQCLPVFWGILALIGLHRWERRWSLRSAFGAGLCAAMLALSGGNLGLFFAVLFWPMAAILFVRRRAAWSGRAWAGPVIALVPSIVVCAIFFRPYADAKQALGLQRTLPEIQSFAARPADLINPWKSIQIWVGRRGGYSTTGEAATARISLMPVLMLVLGLGMSAKRGARRQEQLNRFALWWLILAPISLVLAYNMRGGPGVRLVIAGYPYFLNWAGMLSTGLVLLALAGSAIDLMRRALLHPPIGMYLWFTAAATVLCLGPQVRHHGHDLLLTPYALALKLVPALESVRVPARFAAFTVVGLALLTALGLHALRRKRVAYCLVGVLAAAGLLSEWHRANFQVIQVPRQPGLRQAANWVIDRDPEAVVLHLPLPGGQGSRPAYYEAPRILCTIPAAHKGLRTVNGYSGHFSRMYEWLLVNASGRWTPELVDSVMELGIDYVLLDNSRPEAERIGLQDLSGVRRERVLGQVQVYRLRDGQPSPESVHAADIWDLGASIVARGEWDPARATLELRLPSPPAGALLFRDRYLGELVLAREGAPPTACGSAYLDTPFILPGQIDLRAHLRLRNLPWSAGDLDESRYTWSLQVPEHLPIPPVRPPGME